MLNFSNQDRQAQTIAMHYAKRMSNQYALEVFLLTSDINTPAEAALITEFFWNMVDAAAEDEEQGSEIEGVIDLQYWMQRLMNILAGYMNKIGFGDKWVEISDSANGR